MKDLLRLRTSLSEEVEKLLNDQIKMEAQASALYLSMAGWCDRHGLNNSSDYLLKQADEERQHMLKLFRYVGDMGGHAISPEVQNVPQEFDSYRAIFEEALEQEIANTQSFNSIVDRCHKMKDFTTVNFLQWFLEEQIEEEYVARRALELFEVIGEEGIGRYTIDKAIPKIEYKA